MTLFQRSHSGATILRINDQIVKIVNYSLKMLLNFILNAVELLVSKFLTEFLLGGEAAGWSERNGG